MFKCKCKCECRSDFNSRINKISIDSLERRTDHHLKAIWKFNGLFDGIINYLDIEVIPDDEKKRITETQFRKRKQTKGEK